MSEYDPDTIKRMISEGRARQLDRAVDQIEELTAERDRLRAVVEAVRQWRAASPGHESAVAIQAMNEAFDALDAKEGT